MCFLRIYCVIAGFPSLGLSADGVIFFFFNISLSHTKPFYKAGFRTHLRYELCSGSSQYNERGQQKASWLSRDTSEQLQTNLKMAHSVYCVFIYLTLGSLDCLVQCGFTASYTFLLIVTATERRGNLIKLPRVSSFPPSIIL